LKPEVAVDLVEERRSVGDPGAGLRVRAGDGLPPADFPSVSSPGPGREASDEEFREYLGGLGLDDEP
jgi:hypothetical protein